MLRSCFSGTVSLEGESVVCETIFLEVYQLSDPVSQWLSIQHLHILEQMCKNNPTGVSYLASSPQTFSREKSSQYCRRDF